VLIYFVHHVTSGIHINNVIARVGRDLIADIRQRSDEDDSEPGSWPGSSSASAANVKPIIATKTGYIEAIDFDALLKIASRHDLVLRPVRRVGDFVSDGWTMLEARSAASISDRMRDECTSVVTVGRQRTAQQDLRFGIDELVEIATLALSPGIQDPFTAIACIDWLGAALGEMDRSPPPPTGMADEDGNVRIILRPLDFEDYLDAAFGQLRSYVAADPNARAHALNTLTDLATHVGHPGHRTLIEAECAQLAAMKPNDDV